MTLTAGRTGETYGRTRSLMFVEPMLPTRGSSPPQGDEWLHELMYDGERVQLVIGRDGVRLFSGSGEELGCSSDSLRASAAEFQCSSAAVDGELVVLDDGGRSDSSALQFALASGRIHRLVVMAFDLLQIDGVDLRGERLDYRRERLRGLIGRRSPHAPVQFSRDFPATGGAVLQAAADTFQKGVISKRRNSRYVSGHSSDWISTLAGAGRGASARRGSG